MSNSQESGRRQVPVPDERNGFLGKFDWHFGEVSDDELLPCSVWEYARESETIQSVAEISRMDDISRRERVAGNPDDERWEKKKAIILSRTNFDYDGFLERFYTSDFFNVAGYFEVVHHVRESSPPWQELSEDVRDWLTRKFSDTGSFVPISNVSVENLEKLWLANSVDLLEARKDPEAHLNDSVECAQFMPTHPIPVQFDDGSGGEKVSGGFEIDFRNFTDQEILEGMAEWLKENRPEPYGKPRRALPILRKRGGKRIEFRVGLERLGLMRLLHWYSPKELEVYRPDAWELYHSKQESFRREIKEAVRMFHRLFPFLGEAENPVHLERYGTWRLEMKRIGDRIENETRSGGG